MTNIGGPSFFFIVITLFLTAGVPFVVGAALALVHFGRQSVVRGFALANGAVFGIGFVMVLLWSMPLAMGQEPGRAVPYILIFLGTALGVIAFLEALPIGLGVLVTERRTGASRRAAAFAATGGWFGGAIVGLALGAIVVQNILGFLGVIPGGLLGATIGGPAIYRFSRRRGGDDGSVRSRDAV